MIKAISNAEEGLVELLPLAKHKFEDGDEVNLTGIDGMLLKEGETHPELAFAMCTSINETIWKVKVVSPYSFTIGDTRKY
jgi:hypothetical protein